MTRAQIERRGRPLSQRLLAALIFAVFPYPSRMSVALALARVYRDSGLQRAVRARGLLRRFPRLAAMDALLADRPEGGALPEFIPARGRARGRVGVLKGCVQRHLYRDVNRDTARLLSLAGWDVVMPRAQGCCGALELHAGRLDDFRGRARALAAAFPDDLDFIVTNAAGCGSAMRGYGHWLPGEAAVERFAARTRDVSEVLVDANLPLRRLDLTVTYHDACHLAHGQRVRSAPRRLLGKIPGLTLVELRDSELCCGSAGVYNILEPAMADRLLDLKMARIAETGSPIVVTGNPGCLMQIAKGARERAMPLEVVHPVTLLARSAGL
jgi:glycolate oxidase iron-sulfur subunit